MMYPCNFVDKRILFVLIRIHYIIDCVFVVCNGRILCDPNENHFVMWKDFLEKRNGVIVVIMDGDCI